jgi:multidrug efflux pump subunit AcrA (membrane-fusion protein)
VPRRQVEVVVGVAKPVRKDLDVKLSYTADVLPNRQVALFSKVSGYIKRLGADLGDHVKEGQLLAEIEAPELSAAVELARSAVATAEANLKVAESNLEASKANAANQQANLARARAVAANDARNAQRLEDLHRRGLISAMDRDNSQTNAESSQAALGAAEAQLAAAQSQIETQRSQVLLARSNVDGARASLKIAQSNLDNTRILAPFTGYISAHLYRGLSAPSGGHVHPAVGILVLQDTRRQGPLEWARHIALARQLGGPGHRGRHQRTFEARAVRSSKLDPRPGRSLEMESRTAISSSSPACTRASS